MSKKVRVLQYGLSAGQGGIEVNLKRIFDHIDKTRFEFSFIKSIDKACFEEYLTAQGATFYQVPARTHFYRHYRAVKQLLEEQQFDIVHFNVNTMSYSELAFIALSTQTKVILHSHNSAARSKLTTLLHIINRFLAKSKPFTRVAVSDIAGKWLFGDDVGFDVYPNGMDIVKYKFDPEKRNAIRTRYSFRESDMVIGYVSHLLPTKNQLFLIELMLQLPFHYKLLLVGDGADKELLVSATKRLSLEQRVFFAGKQPDASGYYSAFDLFAYPSLFEGFGNVALEAQASGLPVLASPAIPYIAMVCSNAIQKPLNKHVWANTIINLQPTTNRIDAQLVIEQAGFSVYAETKRWETLYDRLVGR